MSHRWMLVWLPVALLMMTAPLAAQNEPNLSEDSKEHEGVPKGEILGPFEWKSEIFPGTVRNYWLYVPKQYDGSEDVCVMVVQDGLGRARGWRLPTVLDNLIHKGEIPVQIGIFIDHGIVPAPNDNAESRYNRSFEYDSLGDRYARFLLEEILPEVEKDYRLSHDPNDRAIAGASSGAICAFNVAWERPDEFRRVISTIGTYVGLRGADVFPTLVRKYEPRPIRVFLEDGSNDLNIYGGDWWMANQTMLSALKFSGYDVAHAWGDGGHSSQHGAEIMPDAVRFIWRDYPEPVAVPIASNRRMEIVIPGEDWEIVSEGHRFTEGPATNRNGELFFSDIPNGRVHRVDAIGNVSVFAEDCPGINGLMFGPDGRLYGCENGNECIVRFSSDGKKEVFVEGIPCNDIVLLHDGSGFVTDPGNKRVWHISPDGTKTMADTGIDRPNGVIVSPDQTLLTVADSFGRYTYSFQIQPDGTLAAKQPYGWLHHSDQQLYSGADGMAVDTEGRIYVTSTEGIQIMDQIGRVNLILRLPQGRRPYNVTFGGPDMDTLFVTSEGTVYRRKVNATGVLTFEEPIKPPKPGL